MDDIRKAATLFSRVWAMPNKNTFSIKPIAAFVKKYLANSSCSVDPFARNCGWATYTNDLNKNTSATYHMECEVFLQHLIDGGVTADLIILDPPYSPRQVKECYDGIGLKMTQNDALLGATWKRRRRLIKQIIRPGGIVIKCGWNTNGMGKDFGLLEVMLVAHGSDHNDTICIAERLPVKGMREAAREGECQ